MTEITEKNILTSETAREFVLRWGDMGSQWGVNRSVAQIHALLFVSERPLTAEEISDALGIARSNTSNSIKELLNWQLIERVPMANDRRDHFIAVADVMTLFRRIVHGRMEREIRPALDTLNRCAENAKDDPLLGQTARERIIEMKDFVENASAFYTQMHAVPDTGLRRMMKMGSSILKYLPGKKEE